MPSTKFRGMICLFLSFPIFFTPTYVWGMKGSQHRNHNNRVTGEFGLQGTNVYALYTYQMYISLYIILCCSNIRPCATCSGSCTVDGSRCIMCRQSHTRTQAHLNSCDAVGQEDKENKTYVKTDPRVPVS